MHRAIKSALVLGALLLAVPVARAADDGLALGSDSKLWLSGTSTIHEYSSTASRLTAKFQHQAWDPTLSHGEAIEKLIRDQGVGSIEVVIPVTGLHSGKDGLDKNLYKSLQAPKYPEIRFVMTGYGLKDAAKPGEMAIDAKGKLTIVGVERELAIAATASREGDVVRLRGRVPLKMTQFGIKPPTMMMGTLRVSDDVVVQFDLRIAAAAVPTLTGANTKGAGQ